VCRSGVRRVLLDCTNSQCRRIRIVELRRTWCRNDSARVRPQAAAHQRPLSPSTWVTRVAKLPHARNVWNGGCVKVSHATSCAFIALTLLAKSAVAIELQPWPPRDDVHHGVHFWHESLDGGWLDDDPVQPRVQTQLNDACRARRLKAVWTMTGLPPQVRERIAKRSAVADIGQAWQATDVAGPDRLPFRRLATSALGERNALVAIEHGGGPNYTELWVFQHQHSEWQGLQVGSVVGVPESLPELMYQVCDGYPKPAPRVPMLSVPSVE